MSFCVKGKLLCDVVGCAIGRRVPDGARVVGQAEPSRAWRAPRVRSYLGKQNKYYIDKLLHSAERNDRP